MEIVAFRTSWARLQLAVQFLAGPAVVEPRAFGRAHASLPDLWVHRESGDPEVYRLLGPADDVGNWFPLSTRHWVVVTPERGEWLAAALARLELAQGLARRGFGLALLLPGQLLQLRRPDTADDGAHRAATAGG